MTATEAEAATDSSAAADGAKAARLHLRVAAGFLLFGAAVAFVTSLQLVFPELVTGSAGLSYGRLLPVGTTALVFGFLGIGAIGAGYSIVTSALGRGLWGGRLAHLNLLVAVVEDTQFDALDGFADRSTFLRFV